MNSRGETNGISAGHYRAWVWSGRCSRLKLSSLYFSSFLSVLFDACFPPYRSPSSSFCRGNGYVFPRKAESRGSFSLILFLEPRAGANETARYYYAAADPCKQWRREKYPCTVNRMKNIWPGFSSVRSRAISWLNEPEKFRSWTCTRTRWRNDASSW